MKTMLVDYVNSFREVPEDVLLLLFVYLWTSCAEEASEMLLEGEKVKSLPSSPVTKYFLITNVLKAFDMGAHFNFKGKLSSR